MHYVGDMKIAEDVVMDCFLKLSEKFGRGEAIFTPKQYLYKMVRNESLDKASHVGEIVQLSETSKTSDNIDDMAERSEREARLWKAIDCLPPVRREV